MKWSLHHFMDFLDILFTSFHGLARYPLYIISWTCSISSLRHFIDLLDILFTSFHGLARLKWCKGDIDQVHEMMKRGYRVSPWNDVKRISSKSISFHGLPRFPLYIISWTCSISSLHHLMDLVDILFTSFHELARNPLYIILWTIKWCKEDF
jgi:hypothetical protein